MPIWLRNFTFNKIKQFYDKEKEEFDKTPKIPKSGKITPPNFKQPTYTAKASKK
jgi:hypothetical protein